jgi:hypothetical protein
MRYTGTPSAANTSVSLRRCFRCMGLCRRSVEALDSPNLVPARCCLTCNKSTGGMPFGWAQDELRCRPTRATGGMPFGWAQDELRCRPTRATGGMPFGWAQDELRCRPTEATGGVPFGWAQDELRCRPTEATGGVPFGWAQDELRCRPTHPAGSSTPCNCRTSAARVVRIPTIPRHVEIEGRWRHPGRTTRRARSSRR